MLLPLVYGAAVGAYTLGALDRRVTDRNDLLPEPIEALVLGLAFALGALPRRWSIIARAAIPMPTFFLYLSVALGKHDALPYGVAFVLALAYALLLTALAAYLSDKPRRLMLRLRNLRRPVAPPR